MDNQSSFPTLFGKYYAIHETINAILKEANGHRMDVNYVTRRVKAAHPHLDLEPATLNAAITQAMKDVDALTGGEITLLAQAS
jgi:hypothetical protein